MDTIIDIHVYPTLADLRSLHRGAPTQRPAVKPIAKVRDFKTSVFVLCYVAAGSAKVKHYCVRTPVFGVSTLDRNRQSYLHIRLFFDEDSKEALAKWRSRLDSHDLTVERQTERAIDAVGTRLQIEQALQVTIEDGPNGPVLKSTPNSAITETLPPIKAYIPRRPTFF